MRSTHTRVDSFASLRKKRRAMTSPHASSAVLSEAAPLWLASGSPRRREILVTLGLPVFVHAVSIDETVAPNESAEAYLERIVREKGSAAARAYDQGGMAGLVPGQIAAIAVADTSVIADGAILGKPVDEEDAARILTRLSGRTHEVWTRFALGRPDTGKLSGHEETVRTRVTFRALSAAQVRAYVATGEGRDKAGGYAIQGRGAGLVSRIEGSYSNVVGLPACEFLVAVERLGLWT